MIPGIIPYDPDDESNVKWLKLIVLVWMIIACWIISLPSKAKLDQHQIMKGESNVRIKDSSL